MGTLSMRERVRMGLGMLRPVLEGMAASHLPS